MIYPDPSARGPVAPQRADHARVYIPPPLIYLFVFWVASMLDSLVPLAEITRPARALGWAIAMAGGALLVWCIGLFRKAGTNLMPVRPTTAVVTDGPYRLTRNPMYLAMLFIYIGVAVGTDTVWAFLLFPVLVLLVNGLVIRREERYLEAKFGREYLAYKGQVRRWI